MSPEQDATILQNWQLRGGGAGCRCPVSARLDRLGRQVSLTALPHNANFCPRRPLRTMSGHISRRQSPAPLCAGNGLGTSARDQHEVPSSDRVQNLQNSFSLGFHPRRLLYDYRETVRDIQLRIRSMTNDLDCPVIAPARQLAPLGR